MARLWSETSGQTLVLAALCLVILVGMLGLSVDAGVLRYQKRQMQNLADAAALAGALEVPACAGTSNCTAMRSAAQTALTENSVGSSLLVNCASRSTSLQLTVNNPPCALSGDPNAGNSSYVETVVSQAVPTVFAQVFGVKSVNILARAEATFTPAPCVYLLSLHSSQPSLSLVNQSISSTCAFYLGLSYNFNSGSSSTGSPYYVAGSSSASVGSVSPRAFFNSPVMADPLKGLTAPSYSGCTYVNYSAPSNANLLPGTYCGGLTINTSTTVNLAAGTYIILGALSINGPTLIGSGVTFYVTQNGSYPYGASSIQNVNATLSAPTSGNLQGILYFSDPTLPSGQAGLTLSSWNPTTRIDGVLYLPGQKLTASTVVLQGKQYFGLVADYASMNNATLSPATNYSTLARGTPYPSVKSGAAVVQ